MFPTRQLSQPYVNLMLATMPITLAARIDYRVNLPNLAYHPDARSEADILLDSYPRYIAPITATPRPSSEIALKSSRYFHHLHADIIDYLQNEATTVDSTVIANLFGIDQNEASDRLYELAALGKLRKMRYRHQGSDNLYTLTDRQLTITDIPNGKRNDRILELRRKGYDYTIIGKTYNISGDAVRRLCKSWPIQRIELLTPPVA